MPFYVNNINGTNDIAQHKMRIHVINDNSVMLGTNLFEIR